jgi:hypothetical protein
VRAAFGRVEAMNMEEGNTELAFTLVVTGVLLFVCFVAVAAFFRLWRKERKAGGRKFFE